MPKHDTPIVIAGAGPAGSSLAIRLSACGLPVVLIERYKFPRHKLCGEFISPECLAHFKELGVMDEMLAAGGERISETRFFERDGRSIMVPSSWFDSGDFALSLSRARMDQILLDAARKRGTTVVEGSTVTGLIVANGVVRGVKLKGDDGETSEIATGMIVDATGRARVLSKLAFKQTGAFTEPKAQFVGFKTHLSGVEMPRDVCEIYGFDGGYAGLSFVENGEANLCFLARASLAKENGNAEKLVYEHLMKNVRAAQTLKRAEKLHEWLAVSIPAFGMNLHPPIGGLYSVGDSAAFIDPFTGSGMLMAMESSDVLAECIAGADGSLETLGTLYNARHGERFKTRLRVSGLIRRVAYDPLLARWAVRFLSTSERLCAGLARRTRRPKYTRSTCP